jgi:hypothetical protein
MLLHLDNVGLNAILDDEDGVLVAPYHWRFTKGRKINYVVTAIPHPDGEFVLEGGYWRRKRTALLIHRLLMGLEFGDPREVDHINHNTLDNRRSNLERVTPGQNQQNRVGGKGSSRYMGVNWNKQIGKWCANTSLNYERFFLGTFDSEEEAAQVVVEWRATNMPYSAEARARRRTSNE